MTPALESWSRALNEYLAWNKREAGVLLERRARRVHWNLYRAFREIAPSRDALKAEIEGLGYAIRRRIDPKTGKRATAAREVRMRLASRNWLAASFIAKAWRPGESGQTATYDATARTGKRIGAVKHQTAAGASDPRADLVSFLDGVIAQNRQRGLAAKALEADADDMRVYAERKAQQAFVAQVKAVQRDILSIRL